MKDRISWVTFLQFLGITLVVLGHSLPEDVLSNNPAAIVLIRNVIYSFHMPLFFFLSGYLNTFSIKNRPQKFADSVVKRAKRLLIPYFVIGLIFFVPRFLLNNFTNNHVSLSVASVVQSFIYPQQHVIRFYWFLPVLFWIFVLHVLLRRVLQFRFGTVAIVFLFAVLSIFRPLNIQILGVTTALQYAVFYFLGSIFTTYKERFAAHMNLLFSLLLALSFAYTFRIYWYSHTQTVQIQFFLDFLLSTIGIILAIKLSTFVTSLPKIAEQISAYSFQIFLLSIFPQIAAKLLYKIHLLNYWPTILLMFAGGLFIPLFIAVKSEKIPFSLRRVIGLR